MSEDGTRRVDSDVNTALFVSSDRLATPEDEREAEKELHWLEARCGFTHAEVVAALDRGEQETWAMIEVLFAHKLVEHIHNVLERGGAT